MIYLDSNATTKLMPSVLTAMAPYWLEHFGNPSSKHPLGMQARVTVERARKQVATFIGSSPNEICFTASGTESVGLAFKCALANGGRTILVTAAEHSCVLDAARAWQSAGTNLQIVPVTVNGTVDIGVLDKILQDCGPAFVSAIWVNNETGAISPVHAMAELCKSHGALFHVDAVQAPTRVAIDLAKSQINYLSLSGHKFRGPKGVGVLFVRTGAPRSPMLPGHQEAGLRSGTENTPAIVGVAEALSQQANWREEAQRLGGLRDRLEHNILGRIPGTQVNGERANRVGNTTNIFFPGRSAADMISAFGRAGVCASAGAACSTGGLPSHVLAAMGLSDDRANSSIRFSLGSEITENDISVASAIIADVHKSTITNWGNL